MIFISALSVIFICYLPLISTMLIATYKNARFDPFDNHSIIGNFSSIESQSICVCRCATDSMCKIAAYNGYQRFCVLYLAGLREGQLQIMTVDTNSSVISLRNSTFPTATTLITFDDISNQSSTSGIIPNGYKYLNWTNANYINASTMPTTSGFTNGVITQPFVLYNPTGDNVNITTANGTLFSLDSFYLTSAWVNSLNVTLITIRAGSITFTQVLTPMISNSTYIRCDSCTNIDTIMLRVSNGSSYTNSSTQFIIDNLSITFEY